MARHNEEFKRAATQDIWAGPKELRALAPKYGVDQATIRHWVDVYRQHGDAGLSRKTQGVHYSGKWRYCINPEQGEPPPFLKRIYTTATVQGRPSMLKRFKMTARTCSSAT